MKNIAVIFGGKSVEHDISILTGLQVMANLDRKYKIIPIYITRQGQWCSGDKLTKRSTYVKFTSSDPGMFCRWKRRNARRQHTPPCLN